MNLKQKVKFEETVFTQEIDEEMVLLDMNSENYFGLDEVGTSIWKALQHTSVLSEVLDILLEEYDVSRDVLLSDLEVFISELEKNTLVTLEAL